MTATKPKVDRFALFGSIIALHKKLGAGTITQEESAELKRLEAIPLEEDEDWYGPEETQRRMEAAITGAFAGSLDGRKRA